MRDIMATARVNSDSSIAAAKAALAKFEGSWASLDKAAHRNENGVYVVSIRRHAPVDAE
jgi:hypothetical protein